MKKNLMISAAFLLLLASCSKEQDGYQLSGKRSYLFETSIGGVKNTRGMSKDLWKMGDVMGLYGLDMASFDLTTTPDKWTFAASQNAVGNMTSMICFDPTKNDWRYGAPLGWQDGVNTSFVAVYPFSAAEYTLPDGPTSASEIRIDYRVQGGYDPANATEAGIDTARNLIKKQTDMLVALTKDLNNTTASVPLNFKHTLSQIRFKITNGASSASAILRINDITIDGVNTYGEFHFTGNEGGNTPLALDQWTGHTDLRSFKVNLRSENVNAIKSGKTVDAIDNDDEALIMLPQTLTTAATISITYSYSMDDGSTWIQYTEGSKFDPINLMDIKDKWLPGKRYTFTLKINPESPIQFVPTVESWGLGIETTVP